MNDLLIAAISFVISAAACRIAATFVLRNPSVRFVRTNLAGHPVPAVLGWAVVIGIVAGYLTWAVADYVDYRSNACDSPLPPGVLCARDLVILFPWKTFAALLVLVGGMFAVGLWDDFKGDERPRGFAGHVAALRSGVWTGGLVKLFGGALTSLLAVLFLVGFQWVAIVIAACVALSANLLNLLDRAPGRTLKVFTIVAVGLTIVQTDLFLILAAPLGATLAALPLDLKAIGMLGDAGANPLGAILGLGLVGVVLVNWPWLFLLLIVLLALNLASERWSFSEVIARNRVLARLDQLGRD